MKTLIHLRKTQVSHQQKRKRQPHLWQRNMLEEFLLIFCYFLFILMNLYSLFQLFHIVWVTFCMS